MTPSRESVSDAALVAGSVAGDSQAFGKIVARYQSLVCSLVYSATGSLSQSEDLAQEAFLAGWKELGHLRDPDKLRPWLCTITRRLIARARRRQARDLTSRTELLETADEAPALEAPPSEQAISREEEAILWRSLAQVPEGYREPLVLFYRERQSVSRVAETLGLSEDAVRQRLTRGRKLLHKEVMAFVEGALQRTQPGKAFTLGVLAALPAFTPTGAPAAVVTAAMAKGVAGAKSSAALFSLGAALGPVLGLLGGYLGARASIENTRSLRERRFMIRMSRLGHGYMLLFVVILGSLLLLGADWARARPVGFGLALGVLVVAYLAGLMALAVWTNRRQRQIQIEEGTAGLRVGRAWPFGSCAAPDFRLGVFAALGGGLVGALAWLIILAFRANDWTALTSVLLFGAMTFLVASRALLGRPAHRLRIWTCLAVALGLFTLLLFNARWADWAGSAGIPPSREPGVRLTVNLSVILAYLLLSVGLGLTRNRRLGSRTGEPRASESPPESL